MRCVVCGREIERGYICGRCASERYQLVSIDPFEIVICSKCGSFRYGRRWKKERFEKVLEDAIYKNLKVMDGFEVKSLTLDLDSRLITLRGDLFGDYVEVTTGFSFKLRKICCPRCSRESGGYYESILQLRCDGRGLRDYEIEAARKIIENVLESESGNEKSFISKIEEKKEGIDFYFGSRDTGRKASRKIARELGGRVVESKKLHTRIDGRDAYRFTYLVKLPSYEEGDVVEKGGRLFLVKSRKSGRGVDIFEGKSVNISGARIVARKGEMRSGVVVNVDERTVEIVSDNGEVFVTDRPCMTEIGSEVLIFEFRGKLMVFPKDL